MIVNSDFNMSTEVMRPNPREMDVTNLNIKNKKNEEKIKSSLYGDAGADSMVTYLPLKNRR